MLKEGEMNDRGENGITWNSLKNKNFGVLK